MFHLPSHVEKYKSSESENTLTKELDDFVQEFFNGRSEPKKIKVETLRNVIPKFQKNYRERNNFPKKKSSWENPPPPGWPSDIPYIDPNNPKSSKKPRKVDLQKIVEVFVSDYQTSKLQQMSYHPEIDAHDYEYNFENNFLYNNNFEEENSLFLTHDMHNIQAKERSETISESDLLWDSSQRIKMKVNIIGSISDSLPKDVQQEFQYIKERKITDTVVRSELEQKLDEIKREHHEEINKRIQSREQKEELEVSFLTSFSFNINFL
ncbi:DgyrCDS11783 [Dimorphilus gyrociliatus]|uniref:DgyrCDS11783 n=1 Tax=Dimorphilus gyrociliatus TaxID=2664684 RepID=A0A7I8W4F0_9ANNE|nr:DgyrCDS11783 [Dimorphilus gyrociliatus]